MNRKSWPITALILVNAALLALLLFSIAPERSAQAQVRGGGRDYVVSVGNIQSDYQALYLIDLAQQRLTALLVDKASKRIVRVDGRDLVEDFTPRTAQPATGRGRGRR